MKKKIYTPIKRTADIVFGIFGCIPTLPILAVVKIAYLATGDKNPIIYKHTRIGKDGKEFELYKFRSMFIDADERLKELLKDKKHAETWEKYQKLDDDPRITKVGKILRKTSIDELPQILNIIKGDMSLIGPRPLLPGELKQHKGKPEIYEKVRPGITGWWAANGRSNCSYKERLELEYYYVENYSLSLDLKCVGKTIGVVLNGKGAK